MKRIWLVTILAIFAVSIGCGGGGKGAEKAATEILDGMMKGDMEPLLDHMDWDAMAKSASEDGEAVTAEQLRKQMGEMMAEAFKQKVPKGAKYEITGSEEKDGITVVNVKVKESEDAEWKEQKMAFENVNGKWLMTEKSSKMME